jgi:small subunit ribosomal protein S18
MAFITKRKFCYFKENGITDIDYKDTRLLRRFVTEQGKIRPRRVTGSSARMHRKLVRAIKRARNIALMPFVNTEQEGS